MDSSSVEEQLMRHAQEAIIRVLRENVNGCTARQIWNMLRFSQHKAVITSEQKTKEILDGLGPNVKIGREIPAV